ncbi:hypothetical protein GWI33_018196 [Rhynchophorus ferrugineus]|uniref:Uncharacterized protein n=1 Tax=Rhynchophorus ferrugineus TaxID=354439 RepID=A0A834HYC3_RHYFE|nr:hypothetical protein GWI33_018196 [Rhynchophorus ferrugineus]
MCSGSRLIETKFPIAQCQNDTDQPTSTQQQEEEEEEEEKNAAWPRFRIYCGVRDSGSRRGTWTFYTG